MKHFQKKSVMLIMIYTISIFIFSLAYNICFRTEYQTIKDSPILSDSYAIINFNGKNAEIKKLNQWAKNENCHYFMTVSEWSQGKTAAFSDVFFKDMKINTLDLSTIENNADVAVVNKNALDMCYEIAGKLYLKMHGVSYKVIATYEDSQDDKIYETFYYLNQNAKSLQNNRGYDYLLLEPVAGENLEEITESFQQAFPNTSVFVWNGNKSGGMDNRPYFVLVTMLTAVLLCINCIGFSNEWIKAQIQELGVRQLVGATNRKNHLLLLKRLFGVFFISFLWGILLAVATLFILHQITALKATRNLFGTYVYAKSIFLAGGSVWIIGVILMEINRFSLQKRNIIATIRGRK